MNRCWRGLVICNDFTLRNSQQIGSKILVYGKWKQISWRSSRKRGDKENSQDQTLGKSSTHFASMISNCKPTGFEYDGDGEDRRRWYDCRLELYVGSACMCKIYLRYESYPNELSFSFKSYCRVDFSLRE